MDVLWHQTDKNARWVLRLSWCRGIMGWAGGEPWVMMKLELLAIGFRILKLNKRMWCQPCHQLTSYCRLVPCQGSCENWRNKKKLLAPMYWWVVLLCRMYKRASWVNQKTCAVQANSLLIHCRWITFGMFDSWGSVELLPSWLFILFILQLRQWTLLSENYFLGNPDLLKANFQNW